MSAGPADRKSVALSERAIRDAKPEAKTRILWDSKVRGLGLRIAPGGTKAFVLNYRDTAGKERRATLARAGEISLAEARDRARGELLALREGESGPLARRAEAREAPTFAELWQRFESEWAPERMAIGRLRESTMKDYRKQGRRYLLPAFGDRRVADIGRPDVEALARRMAATPSQRNRTLALASRLFTLAEHWEWRPQRTNPARGVTRAREEPRDRTLSPSELAALGEALDGLAARYPAPVAAIRLCAVTAFRISEALAVRWQDIDFEAGRVRLPDTKTGRQVRAVPRAALALLSAMPRIDGCDWVFSGTRGAPVGYSHARDVFAKACEAAGLADCRLHDLRRTVATNAAASGVGLTVLRDVLGHAQTAMAARYARMADSAVAAAIESTGGAIAAAMGEPEADVADLAAERARRNG